MIVTNEMRAKILATYNAMKTSGEKAAYSNKLKKAGLPHPTASAAKHDAQYDSIRDLLAMSQAASQPAKAPEPVKAEPAKKAA
jgi:hypothetical protein